MSPEQAAERATLYGRIRALIERLPCTLFSREPEDTRAERDALLIALAHYQARYCPPYGRFVAQRAKGRTPTTLDDVPALPTDAFRFARVSSRDEADDVRTFESSGTTNAERSRHSLADLSLYDLGAERAARYALFPDRERVKLIILAPSEQELWSSSLSHMLTRFVDWFGTSESTFIWPAQGAELTRLDALLRAAERSGEPVALLGTSFAFVHALDGLSGARYALPVGSRVMQTGGFKGRSREIPAETMRAWLAESFGVPEAWVVAEYGMTELSSQLYETTLRDAALGVTAGPRRLWAPPWVRARPVHPEMLTTVTEGEEGLVRIDDAANLDTVSAIQTADVGRLVHGDLVLLGRARGAVARGCSITADELLGGAR